MSDYQFLQLAGVFIMVCIGAIFLLWLMGWFTQDNPFVLKNRPKGDAKRTFEKPPQDDFNPYWIEEYKRNHPEDQE